MKLSSKSFENGGVIPGRCAFAVKAPRGHVRLSDNLNPELSWTGTPTGTKSFVLLCIDPDVPTKPDDVNKEDREVPLKLPRTTFTHWAMVDIGADVTEIEEGAFSRGVTARGKRAPAGPEGSRQGINDYTGWFKGDADMGGDYLGYDGPCPPWNDSVVHHYRFELHALDVERCAVEGSFTAADVQKAIQGHVLGSASITGRFSLNPRIRLL
ncbi:PBP family phospholipid-binding protein [Panacagrimonas perspica]|uniref:PBP family phospholipid-binding protein n=1 Tax=Panacagrimonas perspica TaxID=381431 RepID=A0A4S3K1X0_9GAMM|nr:YbhB/YbcL family Raf kinase inhibitor-like protein [Panacagrimonas perspica]TDU30864.1 PBP family phospholipid-binding protein [Panacagrimonas perspica]THD01704.1 phospholipid-binding protein [Panacagrimonas perspica]